MVLHAHELASSVQQGIELAGRLVGQRTRLGPQGPTEGDQDRRVDRIGLGQPAGRLGEIAGLARVDHGHRQPGGGQRGGTQRLQAASGLQDDQGHRVGAEAGKELVEALTAVGDLEGFLVADGDVECGLGDIDTNVLGAI